MSPGDVRTPATPEPRAGKPWSSWVLVGIFYAAAIGIAVLYGLKLRPDAAQRKARLDNAVNIFNPANKSMRNEEASYRELTEAIEQYEGSVTWSKAALVGIVGCFAIARVVAAYARMGGREGT